MFQSGHPLALPVTIGTGPVSPATVAHDTPFPSSRSPDSYSVTSRPASAAGRTDVVEVMSRPSVPSHTPRRRTAELVIDTAPAGTSIHASGYCTLPVPPGASVSGVGPDAEAAVPVTSLARSTLSAA